MVPRVSLVRLCEEGRINSTVSATEPNLLSRRQLLWLASGAAATLFLPACGGGGGSQASQPPIVPGIRAVYSGATLSAGFDLGYDTSAHLTGWLKDQQGFMDMAYPPGQQFGVVFITAGTPTSDTKSRQRMDYSSATSLLIDLKGANGGEQIDVGVKTESDPDNGQEPKFLVSNLTTSWQTYTIPLSALVQPPNYPAERLGHLYVCLLYTSDAADE